MTLSEMADFVCGKVRQTDTRAVAKCKAFLKQRYELIWNEALWRDSLFVFDFTFVPQYSGVTDRPESWDSTWMMPSVVDKVVAIRTAAQDVAAAGQDLLMRGSVDHFAEQGDPVIFATLPPCVALLPEDYTYHDPQILGGSAGTTYTAFVIDSTGARIKVSGTFVGNPSLSSNSDARVIERISVSSPTTALSLTVNATDNTLVSANAEGMFEARIPVRLIPGPTAATTALKALVKKKVIPLSDDNDEPELRNVDNALLAFAQGDMWEYARQIGKAGAKYQEAGAMLGQLKQMHTWQEQTLVSCVPDVGDVAGSVGVGLTGKGIW